MCGTGRAIHPDAPRRSATHWGVARKRSRLHDVARCSSARWRHCGGYQPHPTRRRTRSRHHVHRVSARDHRTKPSASARWPRSWGSEQSRACGRHPRVRRSAGASSRRRCSCRRLCTRDAVLVAVHQWHQRRAQSSHYLARALAQCCGFDDGAYSTLRNRRHLHLDAVVSQQRIVHSVGAQPGFRCGGGAAAHL